eukprot:TRINITY_DN5137_c0_g1_i1.p1 TRINITY_DN5137_c0_g1~~TRINITY_DN5137_c0_g1_i1.p1  ORF type:complete len:505 (+),score=101.34 TRINITY_DN5137_c0_g1_i1:49-1563(+)
MRKVSEKPGSIYCLRDLLEKWGIHEERWSHMSRKWRCVIAKTVSTNEECLDEILEEKPCLLGKELVSEVHKAAGEDGIDLLTKDGNNKLPRKKLAFNSSWGKPGADLIHEDHLTPIDKFSDVLDHESDNPRNLQMFHRNSEDEPRIPILPSLLSWPSFMEEDSVSLDKATRLSQKNALTTWHLDDCGEFVFQTALPVKESRKQNSLIGPNGRPVMKMFFTVPRKAYDMITQDQEQNRNQIFAMLDLWNIPDNHLPSDENDIPLITLCLVEEAGNPLLMYPNLPHTVLTVQDSVLIEERRASLFFLDECVYFVHRGRQSTAPPINYDFFKILAQEESETDKVVNLIENRLATLQPGRMRTRLLNSLKALGDADDVFAISSATQKRVKEITKDCKPDGISLGCDDLIASVKSQKLGVIQNLLQPTTPPKYFAYGHVMGAVVFGPMRTDQQQATLDRKAFAAEFDFLHSGSPKIDEVINALPAGYGTVKTGVAEQTKEDADLLDELF